GRPLAHAPATAVRLRDRDGAVPAETAGTAEATDTARTAGTAEAVDTAEASGTTDAAGTSDTRRGRRPAIVTNTPTSPPNEKSRRLQRPPDPRRRYGIQKSRRLGRRWARTPLRNTKNPPPRPAAGSSMPKPDPTPSRPGIRPAAAGTPRRTRREPTGKYPPVQGQSASPPGFRCTPPRPHGSRAPCKAAASEARRTRPRCPPAVLQWGCHARLNRPD